MNALKDKKLILYPGVGPRMASAMLEVYREHVNANGINSPGRRSAVIFSGRGGSFLVYFTKTAIVMRKQKESE